MNVKLQHRSTKAAAVCLIGLWGALAIVGLLVAYGVAIAIWVAVLQGEPYVATIINIFSIAESIVGVEAPLWFYGLALLAYLPLLGIALWGHIGGSRETNNSEAN